ncbi:hypothetical protein [Desulfovibrio cuneatus]|uniref:hypothetical protein n=1 Tax=Desulfovibrio cuneatus TaxID=159728 RepID=UPI000404DBBA|nr:hypothetical protein [Desulfovibrio cuneatus]
MILFAAGDPGGSRALAPILHELCGSNRPFAVVNHGFLGKELPKEFIPYRIEPDAVASLMPQAQAFVFGSSVSDPYPLHLARLARSHNVPVIHVLDNWASYSARLCTDGQAMLLPDVYAVMDEDAKAAAMAQGIPEQCLAVTGHPGLAIVAKHLQSSLFQTQQAAKAHFGLPQEKLCLAFVCEPFHAIFGADVTAPGHPGFTDHTVLHAFAQALLPYAGTVHIALLPHPKQTTHEVATLWDATCSSLGGTVIHATQGRDVLQAVNGVAGMASILLYEAWLMGLPVLSMQPGVRLEALQRFAFLDGLCYTQNVQELPKMVANWVAQCSAQRALHPRPELALHAAAPAKLVALILSFIP